MNKQNRKELEHALLLIDEAKGIVEQIRDEEQEKYDNLSEGLQQSEKGQKFEANASDLDEALNNLEEAIGNVNNSLE